MIILIDSSQAIFRLSLVDGNKQLDYEWLSDRQLARGILSFIRDKLLVNDKNWDDIAAIGVFQGPGSFTGLRIGLTVANTLADGLSIPIVSGRGDDWQKEVLIKIDKSVNQRLIMPFYGSEANITKPKK